MRIKLVIGFMLCITMIGLVSCDYFDPLDPSSRGIQETETIITWERVIGGVSEERGMSVEQTRDGGFIIAGFKQMLPGVDNFDFWLIKTDPWGNVEWDHTFDGYGGEDRGYSAHQTVDGGFIVVGYMEIVPLDSGNYDVWLIKTDESGIMEWDETYGGADGDYGFCVQITEDNGYVIVGETTSYGNGESDVWLVKTDSTGVMEWSNFFGGDFWDYGTDVLQTSDGGYILSGVYRPSFDDDDGYLVKTDAFGNLVWSEHYGTNIGGPPENIDRAASVLQISDGRYIFVGERAVVYRDFDAWMTITDASGNEQWSMNFGGTAYDRADAIQPTEDGGYIIAGMVRSNTFFAIQEDVWLIKTDASGNEQWNRRFGGTANDAATSVKQTADGGYIAVGFTNSFAGGDNVYLVYYKP